MTCGDTGRAGKVGGAHRSTHRPKLVIKTRVLKTWISVHEGSLPAEQHVVNVIIGFGHLLDQRLPRTIGDTE